MIEALALNSRAEARSTLLEAPHEGIMTYGNQRWHVESSTKVTTTTSSDPLMSLMMAACKQLAHPREVGCFFSALALTSDPR